MRAAFVRCADADREALLDVCKRLIAKDVLYWMVRHNDGGALLRSVAEELPPPGKGGGYLTLVSNHMPVRQMLDVCDTVVHGPFPPTDREGRAVRRWSWRHGTLMVMVDTQSTD